MTDTTEPATEAQIPPSQMALEDVLCAGMPLADVLDVIAHHIQRASWSSVMVHALSLDLAQRARDMRAAPAAEALALLPPAPELAVAANLDA